MEDSLSIVFFASIALALVIILVTGLFAKRERTLLGWGALASVLVLVQFLILRHNTAYTSEWRRMPQARVLWLDAAGSVLVLLAYFGLVILKAVRSNGRRRIETGHGRESSQTDAGRDLKQAREVPVLVPALTLSTALIGAAVVSYTNELAFQLLLVFPTGLLTFAPSVSEIHNETLRMFLGAVIIIVPYGIYLYLIAAMFRAWRWNTFGVVCFILACVLLLNVVGCRQMAAEFSRIR